MLHARSSKLDVGAKKTVCGGPKIDQNRGRQRPENSFKKQFKKHQNERPVEHPSTVTPKKGSKRHAEEEVTLHNLHTLMQFYDSHPRFWL